MIQIGDPNETEQQGVTVSVCECFKKVVVFWFFLLILNLCVGRFWSQYPCSIQKLRLVLNPDARLLQQLLKSDHPASLHYDWIRISSPNLQYHQNQGRNKAPYWPYQPKKILSYSPSSWLVLCIGTPRPSWRRFRMIFASMRGGRFFLASNSFLFC